MEKFLNTIYRYRMIILSIDIQLISMLSPSMFQNEIEMRYSLFVGCEFVTRIFTFASVHVKDFTFFLVLVRRVSKEIIILHFCLECHHISRTTKRVDEIMKQQET